MRATQWTDENGQVHRQELMGRNPKTGEWDAKGMKQVLTERGMFEVHIFPSGQE